MLTGSARPDFFWTLEGQDSIRVVAGDPPSQEKRCQAMFDYDDGDTDGVDFSKFASCYNGSGNPPKLCNIPP